MSASEIILQIAWVAAHAGLRSQRWRVTAHLWPMVHEITRELGGPPAPIGPL